ncbi:MAG: hypothetical protein WCG49_00065 [Actinomycetes bacterium]
MPTPSAKDLSVRIEQHVKNARFIGKLSVDMAQKKMQQMCSSSKGVSPKVDSVQTNATEPSNKMPMPNYDSLTAIEIVTALKGCPPSQVLEVFNYENEHRQRRTILKAASPSNA